MKLGSRPRVEEADCWPVPCSIYIEAISMDTCLEQHHHLLNYHAPSKNPLCSFYHNLPLPHWLSALLLSMPRLERPPGTGIVASHHADGLARLPSTRLLRAVTRVTTLFPTWRPRMAVSLEAQPTCAPARVHGRSTTTSPTVLLPLSSPVRANPTGAALAMSKNLSP
jgi:hypothetical protein